MKRLIVTRADDNVREMTDLTHPIIKQFAKKWKAELVLLKEPSTDSVGKLGQSHYRIMQIHDLLDDCDQLLSLDSDVLITPHCPNLFEVVPKNKIGTVLEDKGSRSKNRRQRIAKIQKKWGDVGWKQGYINIGVSMFSEIHKEVFTKINNQYWNDRGFADVHIGYQIKRLGLNIHELPYQFNHMTMFSEKWNRSPNRFKSFIIHYAGAGIFDQDVSSKMEQIKKDIKHECISNN